MSTEIPALLAVGKTERLVVEMSPTDVERFAALSGDHSRPHVDESYARAKGFPGKIAHGLLIGAYVSALVGTKLPGDHGILQSVELEFRRPVVPPDQLTITGEITNVSAGTGQITIKITVANRAAETIATGKVKSIVRLPA